MDDGRAWFKNIFAVLAGEKPALDPVQDVHLLIKMPVYCLGVDKIFFYVLFQHVQKCLISVVGKLWFLDLVILTLDLWVVQMADKEGLVPEPVQQLNQKTEDDETNEFRNCLVVESSCHKS